MEGGLGFEAGNGNGPGADKEKGEERVKGRHGSRRWPARGAEAEDGRRRATRAGGALETERGREEAADRWARRGFSFSFSFFFLGCDNSPSLKKISSRDLGRQEGTDKIRTRLRPYSPR